MTISYEIHKIQATGLRRKSVFVLVKNTSPTTAYRRAEIVMPLSVADERSYIDARYSDRALWDQGAASEVGQWLESVENPRITPIYRPIVRKAFEALKNNDVDTARTLALQLIGTNETLQADFQAIGTNLGLIGSLTDEEKREQLLWLLMLAVIGVINGER